jgi:hypothetical protein
MSTQRNNSKQSLQGEVTNRTSRVGNRPNVATRYRFLKLIDINIGQECRRYVDELVVQRAMKDAIEAKKE